MIIIYRNHHHHQQKLDNAYQTGESFEINLKCFCDLYFASFLVLAGRLHLLAPTYKCALLLQFNKTIMISFMSRYVAPNMHRENQTGDEHRRHGARSVSWESCTCCTWAERGQSECCVNNHKVCREINSTNAFGTHGLSTASCVQAICASLQEPQTIIIYFFDPHPLSSWLPSSRVCLQTSGPLIILTLEVFTADTLQYIVTQVRRVNPVSKRSKLNKTTEWLSPLTLLSYQTSGSVE